MPIQGGLNYNVDIVMCIDKTGSMSSILGRVKANALSFYKKFIDEMEAKGKAVDALRIKVIGFGDYGIDSRPMMISKFFNLPTKNDGEEDALENDAFKDYVNSITHEGGGDLPENALEAIAHAIKSDWTDGGNIRRHVILLFTDTSALELGVRTDFSKDDEQITMPSSLAELGEWWDEMEPRARRMVIFAPNGYPWDDLTVSWNSVVHIPSAAGEGCEDVDFDEAIRILVESVASTTFEQ